ncbi:MAG: KamA family radical SAM protein [Alphaproteobacteria bacterium]|nr:KamA family radical SAM protein [Alphaproteobacteria bacterium]
MVHALAAARPPANDQIAPLPAAAFPLGVEAIAFKQRFYPDVPLADWNDWRWQLRNRIKSLPALERVFVLSGDEREAVARAGSLPLGITPYYAGLMGLDDPQEPLRRTHIPVMNEYTVAPGESDDPLGEDPDMVAPGLVHRYPDRALFLVTSFCSTYCRYCNRSRIVGSSDRTFAVKEWEQALAYLRAHTEVRDVLLSGGDPLTIADDKLEWLLGELRAIKHIEFLRIGTKVPVVLPQRITPQLASMLRKFHPLWMSIHINHPRELTAESTEALVRLADAGIPLGSQTVLMKGINDDIAIIKPLMHGLLKNRVKPYYLFQMDPITGSSHFRTPVSKGLEIIDALRGHTSGYAVPVFAIDAPGGGGKVALVPERIAGRDGDYLILHNFEGAEYRYYDPAGTVGTVQKHA